MALKFNWQAPEKNLAHYGKSFYFASQVFKKDRLHRIAILYSFCRFVDDCADELPKDEGFQELEKIKSFVEGEKDGSEASQKIRQILAMGVPQKNLLELISGAQFDNQGEVIQTEEELYRYCYLVAGVVGLMMCPLLGVEDKESASYAVSLGVGMQLTNICRDVLEDAQNGRCYLPHEELEKSGIKTHEINRQGLTPVPLKALVEKYLIRADEFYLKGYEGLAFIPLRPRLAILLAGEVYRSIGHKLSRQEFNVLNGRTYLNMREKIWVSLKALRIVFRKCFWLKPRNEFGLKDWVEPLSIEGKGGPL